MYNFNSEKKCLSHISTKTIHDSIINTLSFNQSDRIISGSEDSRYDIKNNIWQFLFISLLK